MNMNSENIEPTESQSQDLMFKVFGFATDKARQNLIIFLIIFFGSIAIIAVGYSMHSERRYAKEKQELINAHSAEKQNLINKYESKIDTLYWRVIKISKK